MDRLLWFLLITTLLLFSMYLPLNIPRGQVYDFKTGVDDFIPLWTPFVVIYISYFGFLIFSMSYFIYKKFYMELRISLLAVIIACVSAYLFYWFFQNKVDRPVIENNNFFDFIYLWINSGVEPFNAFPSLHVAISTICAIGYSKAKSKLFRLMLVWVILIVLSTVFTKQHYFLDVIGGIILAWFCYPLGSYLLGKYPKIG